MNNFEFEQSFDSQNNEEKNQNVKAQDEPKQDEADENAFTEYDSGENIYDGGDDDDDNVDNDGDESDDSGDDDDGENIDQFNEKDGIADEEFDPFTDYEDSYEVSFDSQNNCYQYTEPINDAQDEIPHTQNDRPMQKKRNGRIYQVLSISSFFMSITACLLLALLLVRMNGASNFDRTPKPNLGTGGPSDYSNVTDKNGNTVVWVNPESLDSGDAVANATAKTINSVVVIDVFSSSSDASLDSPSSSGSGVIYASDDENTYIVTCNHVIDGASVIEVTLHSGHTHYADIVGQDPLTDLAVIKIPTVGLPSSVLPFEDSSLKLGQTVIAIGNPLGVLGNSVTSGVISSLERTVKVAGFVMNLLQIDASVNAGNSGGGLFDVNGQLIGIVNAKASDFSVEGIGFAIPYSTIKEICADLIEYGYVTGRASLGVDYVELNSSNYQSVFSQYPDIKEYALATTSGLFGPKYNVGIYVLDVSSSNNTSMFKYGDRITHIDGYDIKTENDIISVLSKHSTGEKIEVTVIRGGKSIILEITLEETKK